MFDHFSKFLNFSAHKAIDYVFYKDFSKDFNVKVVDGDAMNSFMTKELRVLIENSKTIHHIESNGEALLLFTDNLELARVRDFGKIAAFAKLLRNEIIENEFTCDCV